MLDKTPLPSLKLGNSLIEYQNTLRSCTENTQAIHNLEKSILQIGPIENWTRDLFIGDHSPFCFCFYVDQIAEMLKKRQKVPRIYDSI